MQTSENPANHCETCGGEYRAGVCPRCLMRVAFEPEDEPAPPDTPTMIGDYELLEVIAQGAMGVVWRARQSRLRRVVALKLLRESCLPGEEPARRFRIEAEAVAQLRHPHIVTVHEVGEMGGRYFFSMDLLAGSLAERLLDRPFAPEAAAALVAKIAAGVQHAHDRGVLHRDLKPSNILLDEAGEPHVSDFGLARLTEEQEHPTISGALLGTPAYMAPEQATGLEGEVTTRSDVYSLGAVFYELLTGSLPFDAESHLELLRQVAHENPPRPTSLVPGLNRDLETICLKCLEKAPASRYPSARALAEDLERWRRGEPILARPAGGLERLWKWSLRHKSRAALIATAICGLLAIGALTIGFTSRLQREVRRTTAAERTAVHRLATQHGETAAQLVRGGDWLRALPFLAENCALLDNDPTEARIARLRFEAIVRTAPRLSQLWLPEGSLRGVDFDEDRGRVAIFSGKEALLYDTTTGERATPPMPHEDDLLHGHILERGNRLLCATTGNQWVLWDGVKGDRLAAGQGFVFPIKSAPSVLDRGLTRRFLVWQKNQVQPFSLATGEPEGAPMDFGVPVEWAIASRINDTSGTPYEPALYLVGTEDGYLHLRDPVTRQAVVPPIEVGSKALLRGYDWNRNVYAIEAEEGRSLRFSLLDVATRSIVAEARSGPATRRVHGWFGTPQRWCVLAREDNGFTLRDVLTESRLMVASHEAQGFGAAVAASRGILATSSRDGALRIWHDGGSPLTPYLWVGARPEHLMLGAGGRQFLCGSTEPAVRLWERRKDDGAWFAGPDETELAGAFFSENELVLCQPNGRIERWDLARRASIGPGVNCGHAIRTVLAAARGRIALLFSADSVERWDMQSGSRLGAAAACPGEIGSAALSDDGGRVALLCKKGVCRVGVPDSLTTLDVMPDAQKVILSPNGDSLLVIGSKQAQLWALSADRRQPVSGVLTATLSGAGGGGFSPDGRQFVMWGGPDQLRTADARIFETAGGRALFEPLVHSGDVTSSVFSPDGRLLLTTSRYDARLWDPATGNLLRALREHPLPPQAAGFSPDGALLWTRTAKELCIWETATGTLLAPPMALHGLGSALWSPDGRWLAGTDDKQGVRAWDVAPGERAVPEMRALARLLSGHRLTSEGALYPLTRAELHEAQGASGAR